MTRLLASGAAAALGLSLASGAAGAKPFPELIPLPADWNAEGVATGTGTTVYAGSLAGLGIWKGDLRTGEGSVLPGTEGGRSVGLKHAGGLLFVAGGDSGTFSVYDADTGASVATYEVGGGFVNDVTVTRDAAWFTDSFAPVLYRLPLEQGMPAGEPVAVPLVGEWQQVPGFFVFNANGIAAAPDGTALLVINSTTGLLYTVDPATGEASVVETDAELTAGDGILLRGKELAVVRNRLNQIAILQLSPDLASATLVDTLVDPDFAVPTTVAAFGGTLYAVNARFGEDDPAGFEIVKVDGS